MARGLCLVLRPPPPARGSSGPAAPIPGPPHVLRARRPLHRQCLRKALLLPQTGPDAAASEQPARPPLGIPPGCTSALARGRLPSSLRGAPSGAGCEPPVSLSERRVPPAPSRVRFLPSGSRPSHWAVSAPWGPLPGLRLCPLFLDFRAPGGLSPTLGCGAPGWFRLRSLGPGQGRWGRSGRRP